MKLQGRRWRTLVSTVRLGGKQFRVIRPARPIGRAPLYEGRLGAQLTVNKPATIELSGWKEARTRLTTAMPHTVHLPAQPFPTLTPADHAKRRRRRGFHDHLRWNIAADTLFLIGSRPAFEFESDQVRRLAEDCPAHRALDPTTHCCAEIPMGRLRRPVPDRRNPPAELHIECCRDHW